MSFLFLLSSFLNLLLRTKKNLQTRLAKYYVPLDDSSKRALEYDVHRLTAGRDSKLSNVVEVREKERKREKRGTKTTTTKEKETRKTLNLFLFLFSLSLPLFFRSPKKNQTPSTPSQYKTFKIIYRRYAGLYFSIACDPSDNELALLEAIHLFVEVLDHYFGNVCELDLVFNFHRVYLILDEFIAGGEVAQSSKRVILERLAELDKIET